MHSLYKVLHELDLAKIHYTLARYREDYITIHATVVGQRIEIDVDSDGNIETSIFQGSEEVKSGFEVVQKIIEENIDQGAT